MKLSDLDTLEIRVLYPDDVASEMEAAGLKKREIRGGVEKMKTTRKC